MLLDVPRYDFGWQTNYRLAEPKFMPAGTRMDCYAQFDNSPDNPNNPDPKAAVRFGDQTFEEMMIGFFESTPTDEDRLDPTKKPKSLSRLEEFAVIMGATKGQPDDNVKFGAYMALAEPDVFSQFGMILRTMVPQVDRICVSTIKDGKVVELMGPMSRFGNGPHRHHDKDGGKPTKELSAEDQKKLEAALERVIKMQETLAGKLPATDAEGEPMADYLTGSKVVVNNDLTKVHGKLAELMVSRGIKSSMHVPGEVKGQRIMINFWSTDPNAFPAPAEALLTGIARNHDRAKGQRASGEVRLGALGLRYEERRNLNRGGPLGPSRFFCCTFFCCTFALGGRDLVGCRQRVPRALQDGEWSPCVVALLIVGCCWLSS